MTGPRLLKGIGLSVLFTLAACGSGVASSQGGGDLTSSDAISSSGTHGPTTEATTAPTTEPATNPPTESATSESPQSPIDEPFVVVASPLDSLVGINLFTISRPKNCVGFPLLTPLDEDLVVEEVIIGPEGAFVQDNSVCPANRRSCSGVAFPAGQRSTCYVGVRWKPESEVTRGTASLRLSAVCRTRGDRLCQDLPGPPPSEGTKVEALSKSSLRGSLPVHTDSDSLTTSPSSTESSTAG